MKNTIITVVLFAGIAILGSVMFGKMSAKLDESSDRVASLEGWNDELENDLNSITDAYNAQEAEIASLTDSLYSIKEEIKSTPTDAEEVEAEPESEDEEETTEEKEDEKKEEPTTELVSQPTTEEQDETLVFDVVKDDGTDENNLSITNTYYAEDNSQYTYLGVYELTAYEATGSPCANGNYPTCGYTVACNSLPLGTRIYIEGYGEYVVEDRGGMANNVIDIYMGDYSTCIQFGRRTATVYIVN